MTSEKQGTCLFNARAGTVTRLRDWGNGKDRRVVGIEYSRRKLFCESVFQKSKVCTKVFTL
jgi:hypothetical protein